MYSTGLYQRVASTAGGCEAPPSVLFGTGLSRIVLHSARRVEDAASCFSWRASDRTKDRWYNGLMESGPLAAPLLGVTGGGDFGGGGSGRGVEMIWFQR